MAKTDDSPKLDQEEIKLLQQIIGVFLYYARAIDSTLLVTLSDLSAQQTQATEMTKQKANQMLDYLATNSDFTLRFYASDMQLAIESDASYLSAYNARSRVGGYHYLTSSVTDPDSPAPPRNGAVLVLSNILKNVVSSAAEAEIAATFFNGQEGCPIIATLAEMGLLSSPQTTPQPKVSATAQPNRNEPKPLTCASIGSLTAASKTSTKSSGDQDPLTMPITSPSTTPQSIIK
jgi:hypothetical protein